MRKLEAMARQAKIEEEVASAKRRIIEALLLESDDEKIKKLGSIEWDLDRIVDHVKDCIDDVYKQEVDE
jgi:hypothetical protein